MDTRKFSRVSFRVIATVKTANRQFHGSVENLSMNGMFLITREHLSVDQPVEITILLEGSDPKVSVSFNGRVCRTQENGLGFTFEKIELDSYTHLKNIISYNLKDAEKVMEEIHNSIDEKLASDR